MMSGNVTQDQEVQVGPTVADDETQSDDLENAIASDSIQDRNTSCLLKLGAGILVLLLALTGFLIVRVIQRHIDGCLDVSDKLFICNEQLTRISEILDTVSSKKTSLETANKALEDKTTLLEATKKKLEIRLSEMIWENQNIDSDEFTKLEDYSPIKLAEAFRETYDNEYTRAFDESKRDEPKEYLLQILKTAYDLCAMYSASHLDSIKRSIAHIEVVWPEEHEKQKYSQHAVDVMLDKTFTPSEWNDILDIRHLAAQKLNGPMTEALLDVITARFNIQPNKEPKLVAYVKKCLQLCWMMNLHPKPMFIKFIDLSERMLFDTNMFLVYEKAGKYLDYIVWPPLYTHEGGKMLAKGIAKGKN